MCMKDTCTNRSSKEGREGVKMEEKKGKESMERGRDDTQLMFGIVMTSSSSPCCVSGRWSSTVDRNWETVKVAYLFFRVFFCVRSAGDGYV